MVTRMYQVEIKRAKIFLHILDSTLAPVLARLCFPLLSIILCVLFVYPTSNMEFQAKVERITFMVSSRLVSAAEYRFKD